MSENNFLTGQTPYPVNSSFFFASNLSSNHAVAGGIPWNMNLTYNNNQAAGYWPNYQIQPSQPPLPMFPPPQQPPPPSHPPPENWHNAYSFHQQANPWIGWNSQFPSQYSVSHTLPTTFPAFSSISQVMQREFYVGTHNVGSRNVNKGEKGPISHLPKMSWNIVPSTSSIAASREGNKYQENPTNSTEVANSLVKAVTCKSLTSKVDTVPIKATGPKTDCDENGLTSNFKPENGAVEVDQKGRVCVCCYCKEIGHRARSCPIKPCYKCDKVGHRAKKCPKYANPLVATTNSKFDWGKPLVPQPSTSKCATGANAIPKGSERSMSPNKQSTSSSVNSTALVMDNDSLDRLLNEIPKHSDSQKESPQDGSPSVPSRKRQRSCDSLPTERNVNEDFMTLINSIKGVPRKELEIVIMAYFSTIADMERQLNQSKEKVETLEREVCSLRATKETRRSVGIQVELAVDVTPHQQNNYQIPSVKIERIEESLALSGNVIDSTTNKDCPSKRIPPSPPRVSTAPILKTTTPNRNISKSEVIIKTEKP